jgi:hypothetical protein
MSTAKKDTYIERPEFGEDVFTFVAAGEEIPAVLEGRPRHDKPVSKKR